MTDFQPGLGIHMERAFFPTLARFGIDEDKRQSYQDAGLLYPEPGRSHSPTLWRKFQLAFRYMKDGSVNGEHSTRVYQEQPKIWKLTPWGASLASNLAPVVDDGAVEFFLEDDDEEPRENLTRIWFQQNWNQMYPHLKRYLRKHLEKSHIQGLNDDHMHNYVVTAIANDSFHDHLEAGNKIYPSTLCNFVLRRAYTDMRTWGSDPSCRALRGAINERDRRRAKKFHSENPNYAQERVHSREHQRSSKGIGQVNYELGGEDGPRFHSSGTNGSAVVDSYGGDLETQMLEQISMERTMNAIANTLHEELGEKGEDACEIYMLRETAGMTYPEIARFKGIPESRATTLVRKAKAALAARRDEGLIPELDETKFST